VFRDASSTPIGTGPDDTTIAQLNLPAGGAYIVNSSVDLGNTSGLANSISCTLLENSNPLSGGTQALSSLNTFQGTMALTGASTGGAIKIACQADHSATARNRVITAVKVGKLNT
jgi:hypothetical protein